MRRFLVVIALILLFTGCRAPAPSLNVFAPYGSATVPPPATGAVGGSGNYYAPQPPSASVPNPAGLSPPAALPSGGSPGYGTLTTPAAGGSLGLTPLGEPTPARGSPTVAQASFQPGSTAESESSALRIKGMPVSDATSALEPQTFVPASTPMNLADLPPASSSQGPSLLRILNSRSNTNEPTLAGSPAAQNSTANWTTR